MDKKEIFKKTWYLVGLNSLGVIFWFMSFLFLFQSFTMLGLIVFIVFTFMTGYIPWMIIRVGFDLGQKSILDDLKNDISSNND